MGDARDQPNAPEGEEAVRDTDVRWTMRGAFTVVFLGLTAGLQMSDMGVQAVSLSAIQKSFEISDAALGSLQGLAGVLVGSALAIPLARFADRFSRKRLLLCLILASTMMMVLSALAQNFPLFFIGRSAAGITEFAMVPLVYSMIPDLAPERHRVAANLGFAGLMALGASGGFYFAGPLLTLAGGLSPLELEPWRKALLLLAVAGVPMLVLAGLTVDPPRRSSTVETRIATSLRDFLRQRRAVILSFVGAAGFLIVGVQAINHLIALALERRYLAAPGEIGESLGVIVLVTTLGCLPFAGLLDRCLSARFHQASRPAIMALCTAAAFPLVVALAFAGTLHMAFIALGLALYMASSANALVPTMIQDLVPATLRARCFAIWSFTVSVFGALGPVLAGALSGQVLGGNMMYALAYVALPSMVLSVLFAISLFVRQAATQCSANAQKSAACSNSADNASLS